MRRTLWPDDVDDHEAEIDTFFRNKNGGKLAVLVAERATKDGLCGFAEARLRDCADGCTTSPVAYLEGWYVDPDCRRTGVGAALIHAFEAWGRSCGAREAASDAELDNAISQNAHQALGFEESGRAVLYRKSL